MKKKYINPEMDIYEMKAKGQLMAGSDPVVDGTTDDENDLLAPEFLW